MDYIAKWLRFNLLSVLILSGVSAFGVELEPKMVRDFSAGLIKAQDSTLIPDGAAQDLENVDVDSGSIEKRRGSIKANSSTLGSYSSQAVRFIHEYTDSSNNIWMITITSASIYGSKDGGSTNQLITSTHGFTTTSLIRAVNAFGSVWIVDGSTNAISWNGTSVTVQSNVPRGTVIAFWGGRLWVAGVSSTPSTLYGSKIADGTDWTQDSGLDSDAFSAIVRNQDSYQIRAIVPFGRDLLVFKDRSIDRVVVLSDGQTYQLLPITSHLGTVYPESIAVADNAIIWLAHDGYYSYNGSTIRRISEPIQPTVIGLPQLSATSRSVVDSDFTTGTSSHVTTAITAGSILLTTYTATDTTTADFSAGTYFSNVSTATANVLTESITSYSSGSFIGAYGDDTSTFGQSINIGGVSLSTSSSQYQSASSSFFVNVTTKATGPTVFAGGSVYCPDSSHKWTFSNPVVSTSTYPTGWNSWTQVSTASITGSISAGAVCYLDMYVYNSGSGADAQFIGITSPYFVYNGNPISYYVYFSTSGVFIDDFALGAADRSTATFVSQTFDTGMKTALINPTWNKTENKRTLNMYYQSSSDGSTWGSATAMTSGTDFESSRYVRYVSSFTYPVLGSSGSNSFLSDLTWTARSKSGYYIGASNSLSSASSWLPFSADYATNNGTISFVLFTDTNTTFTPTDATTFTSSQTVTSGGTPTLTLPANYAVVLSSLSITVSTYTPQVNSFTLSWGEGSVGSVVSSLYWDGSYYSAVDADGGGTNDTILRYDKNSAWTKYTGLPVYRFGTYRNRMYFGANNDGYIVRMQVGDRYRDYNDSAISAFWIGKDQDLGYPITTKSLLRYYLTAEYTANSTLTASYGVDRGSLTSVTYDLDSTSGFFRQTIKPSSLTYGEGIQHRFKVSNSVIDEYFKILSVTGRWNLNTNP